MRPLAALVVLAFPALTPAQVITSTWNGATGNWTDPALWAPAVPNNGTPPGATYDAVVNGAGAITLDQAIAVQKLDLAAGTFTGGNGLTLNDKFTWSGGTLAGAGATAANAGATFQGGTKTLSRALTLGGTQSDWTGGDLATTAGGTLTNASGSLLRAAVIGSVTGGGSVANAGTFRRVDAGGETTIAVPLTNAGRVEAHEGTLALAGGGSSTGAFDLGTRAALRFRSDYTLGPGSSLGTNSGTVAFSGGHVAVGVPYTPRVTMMNGGSATFTAAAQTHDLYLDSAALAVNSTFTMSGTGTWVGGALSVNAGGHLFTRDGSLFQAVGPRDVTGTGLITNNGTFRRSGDGTTSVRPSLTNFGTLDVVSGTLDLAGGGTSFGGIAVAAGAAVRFSNNFVIAANGGGLAGAGGVAFSGGTVTVGSPYAAGATSVNGGTVTFNAPADLGATALATGNATFNAGATLSGASSWVNMSSVTVNNAALTNAAGGTFTAGGGTMGLSGTGSFVNAGTFRKTGDASVGIGLPLVNTGAVEVQEGVLGLRSVSGTGPISVAAGATLHFGGSGIQNDINLNGVSVTGQGEARFFTFAASTNVNTSYDLARSLIEGAVNFNVPTTLRQTTLSSDGVLGGSAPVTITGPFAWGTATIGPSPGVTVTGQATLSSSGAHDLKGTTLTLNGPTFWADGTLRFGGGKVVIGAGATVTSGTQTLFARNESQGPIGEFVNNGTIVLTTSSLGFTGQGMHFTNAGVVQVSNNNEVGTQFGTTVDLRPGSTINGRLGIAGVVRGRGQVTGPVLLQSVRRSLGGVVESATVAPGDAVSGPARIGTLTFGNTTVEGGTIWAVDLGTATPRAGAAPADINTNDRLAVGSLTFNYGNATPALNVLLNVDGTGLSFQHGQTYDWFLASFGSISGFDPSRFTITPNNFSGGGTFALQTSGNNLVLSFTAAPEPSTLLLCGGAAAAGFFWHRRRSRRDRATV